MDSTLSSTTTTATRTVMTTLKKASIVGDNDLPFGLGWNGEGFVKKTNSFARWFIFGSIVFYILLNYSTQQFWIDMFQQLPGSYVNPDTGRDMFDLIKSRGFDYESHFIETKDGYILQMVRVINPFVEEKNRKRPVLLFHGIMCTGTVFLINNLGYLDRYGNYLEYDDNYQLINGSHTVTNTLGFTLASKGHDVWLANYRGSVYSPNHTVYSFDREEYWKFSMDEMIQIDLPAMIDYILETTNHTSLGYIGYSQGSTLMLGLMSISDHYSKLVKPFISLAPCWYNVNVTSFFSRLNFLTPYLQSHPQQVVLNDMKRLRTILANICSNRFIRVICYTIYDSFVGFEPENISVDRLPAYIYNVPSGASAWNTVQHGQTLETGKQLEHFNYFDEKINLAKYGQRQPPIYNASLINSTDIALFYLISDKVNSLEANRLLKQDLKVKLLDDYLINEPNWNHMSLVWSKRAGQVINKRILKLLDQYN